MNSALSQGPLASLLLLAVIALLPFAIAMTTSFVKFAVVLSILRNAIGSSQILPTIVVTGLAVILSAFVMAPTGARMYKALENAPPAVRQADLLSPGSAAHIFRAFEVAAPPLTDFLKANSKPTDRQLFTRLSQRQSADAQQSAGAPESLMTLVPAFVVGQLSDAFTIGFLLFVPFLVIDLVVANILLALGMHSLTPTTISLPFKLLLFVLIDGWHLLARGLITSYNGS